MNEKMDEDHEKFMFLSHFFHTTLDASFVSTRRRGTTKNSTEDKKKRCHSDDIQHHSLFQTKKLLIFRHRSFHLFHFKRFDMPDFLRILLDRAITGEESGFCNVDQTHPCPSGLILITLL